MLARLKANRSAIIAEGRALLALVIIVVFFASMSSRFLDTTNLVIMTRHVAFNAILALGMLLVILNGGIDLSVGSTVGLSGMVAGYLLKGWEIPGTHQVAYPSVWVVILVGCLVGMLVGVVNGILVAKLNVAPFIATLGMMYAVRGLAELVGNGQTFTQLFGQKALGNTGFVSTLHDNVLGLPFPIWVMIVLTVLCSLYLTRTPFGRWLYASGSNERAAALSGVPVKRVQVRIYVLAGLCAGIVGLLLTADLSAAVPEGGSGYELNAIAAVVIGGAALSGGRGTVRGTIIGAFVIGFLVDGLVLIGVSVFWQEVIKGAVIIVAVVVDQAQQRLQKRRTAKQVSGPGSSPAAPAARSESTVMTRA
ncbi:ABC transporter permease subunit [Planosporangium thailandense]